METCRLYHRYEEEKRDTNISHYSRAFESLRMRAVNTHTMRQKQTPNSAGSDGLLSLPQKKAAATADPVRCAYNLSFYVQG